MSVSKWIPRCMQNPFLNDVDEGATPVTESWLRHELKHLLQKIKDKSTSSDDFHGGAYTGVAGIAYAINRIVLNCKLHRKDEMIENAAQMVREHLDAAKKNDISHEARFLLGSLSIYVVYILIDPTDEVSKSLLSRIVEVGYLMAKTDIHGDGDDEMLAGRAGFLAAALSLRECLGSDVIPIDCLKAVLSKMISSGRAYAHSCKADSPLMYRYHGKHYLGAAHGLLGILQMLISFEDLLDVESKRDVTQAINWITGIQSPNGNIASKVEEVGVDRGENELIHWCHGATGLVHLMIASYIKLNNADYLKCAEAALNLIWQKGILLKGPGICHGTAGSGYAFLLYYRLTNDKEYYKRACCFARLISSKEFQKRSRTPDRPFSLFEGISGTSCFIADLINPNDAQFPLVPIPFTND